MRDDQARAAALEMVEPDGGSCVGSGWSDGHRGHGGAMVVPVAWYRVGDVLCRRFDIEPAGIGVDLAVDRKRQVIVAAVRLFGWLIVLASFAWVFWWV